ncbi:C2 domain containing protein, partial [Oryctes borbonicus]
MPGKVKVKIIAGRNLPVMDRSSDTTDAYVEIKLGQSTFKTDVCKKSLHPQWNSDWYRFEVDDSELQDEPLQIRLMDHDTYSANDAIGKVYLDLNPLLLPAASLLRYTVDNSANHDRTPNSVLSGWFPVYDTMHGIRGEVNIIVKVELFTDSNKFRQSSCGVQFFCSPAVPQGYCAQTIHGFVEELVVNDDPEYQWIDKIRTPRASNEARQTLFFKLSGELQRKIGVKALDLGGNAVIGYKQSFDLEGDSGIVARGIGTAVTLVKVMDVPNSNLGDCFNEERAINYLKFLNSDKGFYLNKLHYSKLLPNLSKKYHTLSSKMPGLKSDSPSTLDGATSKKFKRYNSNYELSPLPPPIIQHASSLQTLLKQEDMRGTPGTGISQKIKNLKYTGQNMLTRKMLALKAKLTDTTIPVIETPKGSANETNRKRYKFRRTVSDSNSMAELLVRTVIQVHSSLDCIMESQDSGPPALQKQISLNESSTNEDTEQRRKSGSFLSLPDDTLEMQSSNPSDLSETSSSDEDESETKDTRIDYDTVSAIVKNVRRLSMFQNNSATETMSIQSMDPTEQAEFDSNEENSLKTTPIEEKAAYQFETISNNNGDGKFNFSYGDEDKFNNNQITTISEHEENEETESSIQGVSLSEDNSITQENDQEDSDSIHWKFEDIPCDYTDKKVLFSLGDNVEESQIPPKAEFEDFDVESSDEEKIHNKQKENSPGKKMIIPPVMMGAKIENKSLVKTAMEMLLLDKVNLMSTYTPPTSPTLHTEKTFQLPVQRSNSIDQKRDESFYPKIAETFQTIRRSSTQSLNHHMKGRIGAKSILIRKDSPDEGDNIHTSLLSLQNHNQEKHKSVPEAPLTTLSSKEKSSKDESFISKTENKLKNVFHSPLHFIRKDSRKKNTIKNDTEEKLEHGLLGTALENVLMDTVSEILVTSHVKDNSDEGNIEEKENPIPEILQPQTPCDLTFSNCTSRTELPTNMEIVKGNAINKTHASFTPFTRTFGSPLPDCSRPEHGHQRTESMGAKFSQSPAKIHGVPSIHRRSSDSDLSITPKGNSLTGSDRSGGTGIHFLRMSNMLRSTVPQENFDIMEYPFLTMSKFPPGFIAYLGGAVSARSVKLLERITNLEEPESRDIWWSEIRMEIRSHARALNCNSVLGYNETTSICDDVCVLSASGTAAIIGYQYTNQSDGLGGLPIIPKTYGISNKEPISCSLDRGDFEKDKRTATDSTTVSSRTLPESPEKEINAAQACSICHLPYSGTSLSLKSSSSICRVCKSSKVPEMLITTIEVPEGTPCIGRGCFLQSYVLRPLKDLKGESNAKEISDGLPFLEYELHRILVNKLTVKGMNAIFGLKVRISIGERVLVGIATGTAVFLSPLPSPPLPKLISDRSSDGTKLTDLQKELRETVKKNKEIYQIR